MKIKVKVGAGHIYSNYWMNAGEETKEIVLMRSPVIDRNEIAKRNLIPTTEHYFRYLFSGLIYSIHDLTALQQGGCDFDGDISFSTNNSIVLKGSYDYDVAKPLENERLMSHRPRMSTSDILPKERKEMCQMIKTLTNLFKQDKEKFVVPKGVQDVLPIAAIYDDGIFQVGKDKFSKCQWRSIA